MFNMDDYNYYSDSRVLASMKRRLQLTPDGRHAFVSVWGEDDVEVVHQVPIRKSLCPTCDGHGTHVNPSIDAGGLTAEDFYDDPDFADAYASGCYDVSCNECGGERVISVLDLDGVNPEVREAIQRQQRADEEEARERAWELRMGC